MLEWLEPVIEKRTEEIVNDIFNDRIFSSPLNKMIFSGAFPQEVASELENLIILHTKMTVEKSYMVGLEEGAKYLK